MAPSEGHELPDHAHASRGPRFGVVVLAGITAVLLAISEGFAQTGSADIIYTRQPVFRIPFEIDPGNNRLKQVQLYVSTDQGRSWYPAGVAQPDQGGFSYRAERDGLYWFAVRTLDVDGRAFPPSLEGARPGLRVFVDTQPPVVFVRPVPPRDGQLGVEWDVRDELLELRSLRLEYRLPGAANWVPLTVDPVPSSQRYFSAGSSGLIEVRLRVFDRFGNPREATTTLTPNGQESRPPFPGNESIVSRAPTNAGVRIVNSKQISLNYEIKGIGRSGVSVVELWYTTDGRSWQKAREDTTAKPPFVFDVNDEGLYGFTLVVRSGAGFGDRPPQVGDSPQVWVEVDLTKPIVQLLNVEVGRGADLGTVSISWQATDKNLSPQPITLSYATDVNGTWTPFASKIENNRRYVWRVPSDAPYKFFVRIEASDKAGNVGIDQLAKEVIVDLAHPKGVILGVEPAAK